MPNGNFTKSKTTNTKAKCSQMTQEEIAEQMAKYSSLSQEELMLEMFRTASESRANGELDNDTLDGFLSQASTMLTPDQYAKMQELVAKLKV